MAYNYSIKHLKEISDAIHKTIKRADLASEADKHSLTIEELKFLKVLTENLKFGPEINRAIMIAEAQKEAVELKKEIENGVR